jgi:hypothetical protein
MTTTTKSGYKQDTEGAYIEKDRLAKLVYSMDWTHWLPLGASVASVDYSHNGRVNDSEPLVIHSQGVQSGNITFAEISGGTVNRIYTVTADITLDSGARDRRAFRMKITNRLA